MAAKQLVGTGYPSRCPDQLSVHLITGPAVSIYIKHIRALEFIAIHSFEKCTGTPLQL